MSVDFAEQEETDGIAKLCDFSVAAFKITKLLTKCLDIMLNDNAFQAFFVVVTGKR